MGLSLPQNKQKKAVIIAICAGILAGAATMFIPTYILERITGTTGLSELIPATAAPLGDKARALIAFGTGALTLAIMIIWLFQREDADDELSFPAENEEKAEMIKGERLTALKDRISNFNLPKMPWVKADNDIRDLADLPNIRAADQHPDAPPRHPLSVSTEMKPEAVNAVKEDLPKADDAAPMSNFAKAVAESQPVEPELQSPLVAKPAKETASHVETVTEEPVLSEAAPTQNVTAEPSIAAKPAANSAAAEVSGPSLGDMIGKLENSMQVRRDQLAQLELMSRQLKASLQEEQPVHTPDEHAAPTIAKGSAPAEPSLERASEPKRAVLEAVADENGDQGEVDTALNAALETLQRMNAQSR